MRKLLTFAHLKGKWHKFISFDLGGGAILYKNFAQKLLAVSLCMAVVLLGTPMTTFADEPTTFITAAKANHWGRSDLRAYLNNGLGTVANDGTVTNKNFGIDSTTGTSASDKSSGYASQFSDAEYALVQPFTYSTNVLNSADAAAYTYETTDHFWLPSGNYSSGQVLGWGAGDVSLTSSYESLDSARAIPISYWPAGASYYSWLRTPRFILGSRALVAYRGGAVSDRYGVDIGLAAAAAFKLDLSSVIFASAASAASLAAGGGSRKFEIKGSFDFGKKTSAALPDYGMYLKTAAGKNVTFTPGDSLTYDSSAKTLIVPYNDGVADHYVVVQAFKQFSDDAETGDLVKGTTSYAAAAKITETGDAKSIALNVSNWKDASDQQLANLDGYTIKVWMEDGSGSLANATTPVTFVGSSGSISITDAGAATNQRVFAMKKDLQTSWGTLANKTDLVGSNPTNQKIYFGTYVDTNDDNKVKPLEFWIAGREKYDSGKTPADGDGEIDPTGTIMTLYQAKTFAPTRQFNASTSNYAGNGKTVTLQLADEQTAVYTGSAVAYPEDKITATVTDGAIDKSMLVWQHRESGTTTWNDGMPTDAGAYELRCYAPGVTDSYERTYSSIVTFNVKYAPQVSDFTFSPPTDLTYDSNQKTAAVITEQSGMGAITVKYYKEDGSTPAVGSDATTAPTNVGTYKVKIDVAAGDLCDAADGLDGGWTFTISYLTPPDLSEFSTDTGHKGSNNFLWFKSDAPASVKPPSGYEISTTLGKNYGGSVTLGKNDKKVYLKNTAGQMTDAINLSSILKWDGTPPEGTITLSTGDAWMDLLNKITFGLFFKEAKNATITASDSASGVASIEYYVAKEGVLATKDTDESAIKSALEALPTGENGWQPYSDPISLIEKSKNVVYAKLTDNVDNISYISSDGIVLYSDSITNTLKLAYTKLNDTNPSFDITLNKNTINEVKLDENSLDQGTDYTVSTTSDVATISLVASKLDEKDAKDYTVTVSFNPQGEAFVESTDNNAPKDVSVVLTINKATPTAEDFTFSSPDSLTYDGEKKEAAVKGQEGMGDITVKYYTENDTPLAYAPKDAGTYKVKIDVAAGETYNSASDLDGGWTFTINKKSITGAIITIDQSTMVYTGKKLEPKITSVTVDGITVPSDAYRMKASEEKQAGETVTVKLTAKSPGNFKGSASTTFTIASATPNPQNLHENPTLEATYGQTLGDIKDGLASAIGSVLGVDGDALDGNWAWEKDDATKVGNVGENKFTAIFTPTDGNYAKTTIDVTVKVSVDTSKWGDAQKRDADGKTQYVDSAGKTSIELSNSNTVSFAQGGIVWLREESYDTSAWYGLYVSLDNQELLDVGNRFYVRWIHPNDDDYNTYYSQLDDAQKARVDDDNGWIFLIGVENPDGEKVQPTQPVKVYVQIGDDWNVDDLNAYYITSGGDENVPVDYMVLDYPEGTDTFGIMSLSHFSPYFIFDELTDEDRAALTPTPNDNNNQTTDKPNSSGTDLPGTGDISTELLFSGLAIVLVSSLGVMLRLITNKKKFEE